MYTASGIQNNLVYVELRVRERDKVKIFLDEKPVTQGKNEKGGTVIPDEEKRWSAGRYAFQLFDGSHTLELVFQDGESGETAAVPVQTLTIHHSFCCVILDHADGKIWCPAPNEYFGKKTHAKLVSDGSYVDPEDPEPEPDPAETAEAAGETAEGEETPADAAEEPKKKKKKAKEKKDKEAEKKEKEDDPDLYSRKAMTIIAVIMISLVLLCVAAFFIFGALTPSPYGQPSDVEKQQAEIPAGDQEKAEEFLQGTWTYYLSAEEQESPGENHVEIEAFTLRDGKVINVSAFFDAAESGTAYVIGGKTYALTGSETRNGTYRVTRALGDGLYELRVELEENAQNESAEALYMMITLDFDKPDQITMESLLTQSGERAGFTGEYERWNYEENKAD